MVFIYGTSVDLPILLINLLERSCVNREVLHILLERIIDDV